VYFSALACCNCISYSSLGVDKNFYLNAKSNNIIAHVSANLWKTEWLYLYVNKNMASIQKKIRTVHLISRFFPFGIDYYPCKYLLMLNVFLFLAAAKLCLRSRTGQTPRQCGRRGRWVVGSQNIPSCGSLALRTNPLPAILNYFNNFALKKTWISCILFLYLVLQ
jgi:hypothetical protein